jgi:hypothetical protein
MVGWMADCWAEMRVATRVGWMAFLTVGKMVVRRAGWKTEN